MARSDFISELRALGFIIQEPDTTKIQFEYEIPVGKNIGKKIILGFDVPSDFPMSCPSGPNLKSAGIPGWVEPLQNIHNSGFGQEWRYWSRPFPEWNKHEKSAKVYMAHIRNILAKM